jgi:hypothetical protein
MSITLNGTTGITTPDVTAESYTGPLAVNASAPDDSVVVDASGNVGIGTSSPETRLSVDNTRSNTAGTGWFTYTNAAITAGKRGMRVDTSNRYWFDYYNGSTWSAQMGLDSNGNLLVGTTTGNSYRAVISGINGVHSTSTGNQSATYEGVYTGTVAGYFGYWRYGASVVGSITSTGSSTSYNTTSDYRLKEDWVAVSDASTRVNALKPVNFAWKADGKRVDGFLAHELAEVVPEAVTGTKDAVDAEGNPVYQGIDQSKLVPLLTAALQEALAKIESLTARVSALEASNV